MLDASTGEHGRVPRERRTGRIVLPVIIVALVLAILGAGAFYSYATGAAGPKTPVTIVIPQGASGAEVADILHRQEVVRSALGFRLLARFKHAGAFRAGQYHLTTNMTASEALAGLEKPPVVKQLRLTIPPGYTVRQASLRVASVLGVTSKAFVSAATSGGYSLPPYLPQGTPTVEGFLSPNTYFVFEGATADTVIRKLLAQFQVEAQKIDLVAKAKALGVSPYEVVVAASLIEEEARFDEDRPKVAAVIYNRLKAGMPLQFDTTIQYALGHPKEKLTLEDLKVDSPYNTYTHTGLPPTPISNPGVDSLVAALTPAHADYLYFIADAQGHETFTASYDEFVRLKQQLGG